MSNSCGGDRSDSDTSELSCWSVRCGSGVWCGHKVAGLARALASLLCEPPMGHMLSTHLPVRQASIAADRRCALLLSAAWVCRFSVLTVKCVHPHITTIGIFPCVRLYDHFPDHQAVEGSRLAGWLARCVSFVCVLKSVANYDTSAPVVPCAAAGPLPRPSRR